LIRDALFKAECSLRKLGRRSRLGNVSLRQRKGDHAKGCKQKQIKRASEKMRSGIRINLFFHFREWQKPSLCERAFRSRVNPYRCLSLNPTTHDNKHYTDKDDYRGEDEYERQSDLPPPLSTPLT